MDIETGAWPELPYEAWKDSLETLHMLTQIVGKVRLAATPFEPQWANVPLYVTARGLTTTPMSASGQIFQIDLDLIEHQAVLLTTRGDVARLPLRARPIADFYREFMAALRSLGIDVQISPRPSEVADPIPFTEDTQHVAYDPVWVTRFFDVLSRIDTVLKQHRAPFRGKTSLVSFFWGSFDLALTRYSGRSIEPPAEGGIIRRRGADAEVICVGFWSGNPRVPAPTFFGYASPRPTGMELEAVRPAGAHWDPAAGEFFLAYDDVRQAASPRAALLEFCESIYAVGARLGRWDEQLIETVDD